ncbi:MAG: NADH-quinone oxidoreductase subunit J [Phycisphaerae bacterium]
MPGVLLITLLALGGVGLYLAMPGGRLHLARAALILLGGAAAALVALLLPLSGEHIEQVWFALLALVGLLGAVRVITHRRPVYSALYFILVIVAVAGMLILMQAEFLAVALLIIYAGAILVTYVFVIMLAQQSGGPAPYDQKAREPLVGVVTGFILLAVLTTRLASGDSRGGLTLPAHAEKTLGKVAYVGQHLLTHYIVGVELAGVLLLAAMVGAIAIARRRAFDTEEGEVG